MYEAGSRPDSHAAKARAGHRAPWRSIDLRRIPWLTLGVIAAGGVIGALARQGLWAAFPHRHGGFDWTTLGINAGGCALIGVLMVAVAEVWHAHRLTVPFLGAGSARRLHDLLHLHCRDPAIYYRRGAADGTGLPGRHACHRPAGGVRRS